MLNVVMEKLPCSQTVKEKFYLKRKKEEFLSWRSGNESDEESWGCGFGPWPCPVGWGSGVAVTVVWAVALI